MPHRQNDSRDGKSAHDNPTRDNPTHDAPRNGEPHHDIIVIGASAGGLEACKALLRLLPSDIEAAIFIVIHGVTGLTVELLAKASSLPVIQAQRGMVFSAGKVYVAQPDAHLLLHGQHMLVRRGPRENRARPAIDPLFRSAAATFGTRVIGIILSGGLNDGTAGLRAIKRCGGIALVQEPSEALVQDMPRSAIDNVEVDHVARIGEMADFLARLIPELAGPMPAIPLDIRLESAIAAQEMAGMEIEDQLGERSPFTCPECHGVLWEIEDGAFLRYRCHVGHAFSAEAAFEGQATEIDRLLTALLRGYAERAAMARRMADRLGEASGKAAEHFRQRAAEYEGDARLVHRLFLRKETGTAANKQEFEGVRPSNAGTGRRGRK